MTNDDLEYRSPWWLPGAHLQTIAPAKFILKPKVKYRRERWTTPDEDFIDVDFIDGKPGHPLIILFHGLEGNSDSQYARALMAHLTTLGWSGAIPHFRSCSGEINYAPRFYHSGDVEELDWMIRKVADHPLAAEASRIYAVGASIGGNVLLRWLGEFRHKAEIVDAACAISTPLDLAAGAAALSRGFNRIYTRAFLYTLKPKCLLKLEQYPGLFDREALLRVKSFYDLDNVVTAPLHGFRDSDDYWERASSIHVLNDITVPTLVLNAENDPFLPHHHLPKKAARCVTLEYTRYGGHVGFTSGPFPGKLNWLPQRIVSFFEGDEKSGISCRVIR